MTRRFHDLLQRYAFVRGRIDAERLRRTPSIVRLARLRTLQLKLRQSIRDFVTVRAIRRGSRPRLVYATASPRY